VSKLSLEERLAHTLNEVASRIPDDDRPLVLGDGAPSSRTPTWTRAAVAAAAILAVLAIGLAIRVQGRDEMSVITEGPRTLLSTEVGGVPVGLRLSNSGGDRCVALHREDANDIGFQPPACLSGRPIVVQATIRGGTTLVYGMADGAKRFTSAVREVTVPHLQQVDLGDSGAFLLRVDLPNASGFVQAIGDDGRILAEAGFDHGGPARPPKSTIGASRILLAYRQGGAVWAVTTEGTAVRLGDGTIDAPDGYPFVAPDGHTVLYSARNFQAQANFAQPLALDARDGSTRTVSVSGTAFSSEGRFVAGSPPVDDNVDVDVAVLDVATYKEVQTVSLGLAAAVGVVSDLGWDAGDASLIAVSGQQRQLWWIDRSRGTATRLAVDGEPAEWVVAEHAVAPGTFPAIRRQGSSVDFGYLRINPSRASFDRVRPLPLVTSQATLQAGDVSFLEPVQGTITAKEDGKLSLQANGRTSYLIGDGTNLFQLTSSGALVFLLGDVQGASAP
jgi:hypothetical protein